MGLCVAAAACGDSDVGPADAGAPDGSAPDASVDGGGGEDAAPDAAPTSLTTLAAEGTFACALTQAGALRCWGNETGATPFGAATYKAFDVSSTGPTVCAIGSDDKLVCAAPSSTPPVPMGTHTFKQVSLGGALGCGVWTDGSLSCWGGTAPFNGGPDASVGTDTDWASVSVSGSHACALKTSGDLYCWGSDTQGQVGDGAQGSGLTVSAPKQIASGTTWRDVGTATDRTCAVSANGALFCWGRFVAILEGGTSGTSGANTPKQMGTDTDWSKVRLSTTNACGLTTAGDLRCWGQNAFGEAGDGTVTRRGMPVLASNVAGAHTDVAAGEGFACAAKPDGSVQCWGHAARGELATPKPHDAPTLLGNPGDWRHVDAHWGVVCATRANGQVACWGDTELLGAPADRYVQSPQTVGVATTWATVHVGGFGAACVRQASGALSCWGQAGTLTGTGVAQLAPASTGISAKAVSVGVHAALAIDNGGALYGWGDDSDGQLGFAAASPVNAPTPSGSATWSEIAVALRDSCGIQGDGTLWCWGHFFGTTAPAKVGTDADWTGLRAGGYLDASFHAVKGGAIQSWNALAPTPAWGVDASYGNGWKTFGYGQYHACGLHADDTLWCAGQNLDGEIGLGSRTAQAQAPTKVSTATDWTSIAVGDKFTCGVRGTGDLYCWGVNDHGEMGDGTAWSLVPVTIP